MKTILIFLLTLSIMIIWSTLVAAQPGLPSPPTQAPIDGGLGILAAAGGTYALKKLREKRKNDSIVN